MGLIQGPIYFYGNSYTVGTGASDRSRRWSSYTARHLGAFEVNRGDSGATAKEIVGLMLGQFPNSFYTWQPGTRAALVSIYPGLNTIRRHGDNYVEAYKHQLRAMIACARSGRKINHTSYNYLSGTWATVSRPLASGGSVASCLTTDCSYSVTFQGDEVTVVGLVGGGRTLQVEYKVDGQVQSTVDYTGFAYVEETDGDNNGKTGDAMAPTVERFTGFGEGNHTLRVTKVGGSGKMYADCVLQVGESTPRVMVVLDCELKVWSNTAPRNNGSDAALASHNAAARAVVAEFGQGVRTTGPSGAWDENTCITSDNVHPNDTGHLAIANSFIGATKSWWQEEGPVTEPYAGGVILAKSSIDGSTPYGDAKVIYSTGSVVLPPGNRLVQITLVAAGGISAVGVGVRVELDIADVSSEGLVRYLRPEGVGDNFREHGVISKYVNASGSVSAAVTIARIGSAGTADLSASLLEVVDLGPRVS